MRLVKPVMKKPLRQQNRQIISYIPRTEPAPPEHAIKMDSFRDVWMLRGKYVAFVLMGESFLRSPAFTVPESAQRWANQIRQSWKISEGTSRLNAYGAREGMRPDESLFKPPQ